MLYEVITRGHGLRHSSGGGASVRLPARREGGGLAGGRRARHNKRDKYRTTRQLGRFFQQNQA